MTKQLQVNLSALFLIPTLLFLTLLSFDARAQCYEFECFENEELAMTSDCIGTRNPGLLLVNPTFCVWGPKELTFYSPTGEEIGDSLGVEYLDMTLVYKLLNVWTGDECYGTVTVVDRRGPDIECENINIACTESYDPASIGTPNAVDNCTSVTSLIHSDEVIDFGCGEQGFTGYFSPENWNECILGSTGDGGVDVTGAPNSISVEGADNSPVSDNCPYVTKFKIELPTDGYISFDWSSLGGSAFDHEDAFITIGDTCVQLTVDGATAGDFTSWLIPAGMWISFEVTSNGNADNMTATFENFQFLTPAIKVIHRTWTAYDVYANEGTCTQVITLERASLEDVQFPENRDGVEAPLLECGASANPTFTEPNSTGYPFLDADGDLSTTDDQSTFVGGNECLIDVYHNDAIIPDCDGNYTIARTWTVYDNCTEMTREELQIIRVADTTPPVFTCPADVTVSTDFTSCSATFNVPSYTATDACSEDISYASSWAFGTNQNTYDVTPGTHQLTVSATDGCGNTSDCVVNVTVEDQVAPTVVCDAITAAAVTSEGTSIVFATSLDDGSYDECCTYAQLTYEVKLADAPVSDYAETILFDCGYVGGNTTVNMRVTDCNGNSNFCTVEVTVQDNDAPAVLCPEDVTIDCGTDVSDLSVFGTVSGADNCAFVIAESISENTNTCGIGIIIRDYSITDPSGNVSTCQQTISIENLTPWNVNENQINFPPDYMVNGDCSTNVEPENLPAPFDFPTYTGVMGCEQPSYSVDDEIFYVSEPACYFIIRTWSILDWCGDGTIYTDTQTITVNDNTEPTFDYPQQNINITLNGSNNCTANVTLDIPEVSDCSDNVEVTISGDLGTTFGTYEDIAAGVYNVTYTATDGCGNSNENSFTVTIIDNTVPSLNCPADMTVDCGTDFSDLTIYGMPTVTESCDADTYTITEDVTEVLSSCGTGFLKREWTINDENGNTSICSQFIYIENLTPWNQNNSAITFPTDYTISGDCNMGTDPEDLPAPSDFPTWTGEDQCSHIIANYEDETIMIAAPNCFQINRNWTVSDICNPGISWTHVQTIMVEDANAPIFIDAPASYTIAPDNSTNCTVNVNIALPELDECDANAEIVLTGDLTEGFGDYDLMPGTYDLTYTATDGCGNTASHNYQITVVDNVAPTAICLSGLSLDIPESQQLVVTAGTFNAASSDNCTAFQNLVFSYSENLNEQELLFNCDDLGNNLTVTIFVTDEAGNQSTCSTSLQINDDENNCGGTPPAVTPDIIGGIFTWESEPVGLTEIKLGNPAIVAAAITTESGGYEFPDMVYGSSYTVTPSKDINHLNGVTTIDAYVLSDHLTGVQALNNPYQMVAGDANRSDDLTEEDVTEIEDAILFNESGFPMNTSWRFIDASYIFPITSNPWAQTFPENATVENIEEDVVVNFVGVKTGDLNGTANPMNFTGNDADERDGEDLILTTTDYDLVAGEDYEINFTTSDMATIIAYQFTLDFAPDALTINELEMGNLDNAKFGQTKLNEGALTGLWFNKTHSDFSGENTAFTLRFTANQSGKLSGFLNINSRFTTALSYHEDNSEASVQLEFREPVIEEEEEMEPVITDFALLGCNPNPFARKTTLAFEVPQDSPVTFSFYTLQGKEIFTHTASYSAGAHTLEVTREDLNINTDALLLYRMKSGEFTDSGKLVLVRQ
jgi:hypothetical protein